MPVNWHSKTCAASQGKCFRDTSVVISIPIALNWHSGVLSTVGEKDFR